MPITSYPRHPRTSNQTDMEKRKTLMCDTYTGSSHPVVSIRCRCNVFNTLHKPSIPGIRATTKLIGERFHWAEMNKAVKKYARSSLGCQESKFRDGGEDL